MRRIAGIFRRCWRLATFAQSAWGFLPSTVVTAVAAVVMGWIIWIADLPLWLKATLGLIILCSLFMSWLGYSAWRNDRQHKVNLIAATQTPVGIQSTQLHNLVLQIGKYADTERNANTMHDLIRRLDECWDVALDAARLPGYDPTPSGVMFKNPWLHPLAQLNELIATADRSLSYIALTGQDGFLPTGQQQIPLEGVEIDGTKRVQLDEAFARFSALKKRISLAIAEIEAVRESHRTAFIGYHNRYGSEEK